jgi:DNA-binding transcriptional regulator YdaS (Cro superfamily)
MQQASTKQDDIKMLMTLCNLKITDMARLLAVTPTAVNYWISGHREMPENVAKMIRLFIKRPELMNEFF